MKRVYFIRPVGQSGPVLIGCTMHPTMRLKALASGSPVALEVAASIPGDNALARRLRGIFAGHHSHGHWFKATEGLAGLIDGLAAGVKIAKLIDLTAPVIPFTSRRVAPERKRYIHYRFRVSATFWRRRARGDARLYPPRDVDAILARWRGPYGGPYGPEPKRAEIARLDEVLANPAAHGVTYEQRYPERATVTVLPRRLPTERAKLAADKRPQRRKAA